MQIPLGRFSRYSWIIAVMVVHFILVNHFFPVREVFDNDPIVTDDYPYHLYRTLMAVDHLKNGAYQGLDDNFSAGRYSLLLIWDKVVILLSLLLFFIPTVVVFKFYLVFQFLLVPIVCYFITRNFGGDKNLGIISAFVSVIVWHFHAYFRLYLYAGVYSYFVGSVYAILSISLLYRYTVSRDRKHCALGVCFSLYSLLLHPLLISALIVPCTLLILRRNGTGDRPSHYSGGYTVLALIAVPLLVLLPVRVYGTLLHPGSETSLGLISIIYELMHSPVQTVLLILGIGGVCFGITDKYLRRFFITCILYFGLLGYFGSYLPFLSSFKPYRLLAPLAILAIFPSTIALRDYANYIKSNATHWRGYMTVLVMSFILIAYFCMNSTTNAGINDRYLQWDIQLRQHLSIDTNNEEYVHSLSLPRLWDLRITTEMPYDVQLLLQWIRATNCSGRILIEDSGFETNHQYGGHIISQFPLMTGCKFFALPGTYVRVKDDTKTASLYRGKILGVTLEEYNAESVRRLISDYDIKWAVVFSGTSKYFMSQYPEIFVDTSQIGKFTVYHINQE